jgi:hypothetical protein
VIIGLPSQNKIELIDAGALGRLMLESNLAAGANSVEYSSLCHFCGDVVRHSLRAPRPVTCKNGHEVQPSLDTATVLKSLHPWDTWGDAANSSKRHNVARTLAIAVLASHGWGRTYFILLALGRPIGNQEYTSPTIPSNFVGRPSIQSGWPSAPFSLRSINALIGVCACFRIFCRPLPLALPVSFRLPPHSFS